MSDQDIVSEDVVFSPEIKPDSVVVEMKAEPNRTLLIAAFVTIAIMIVFCSGVSCYRWRRKRRKIAQMHMKELDEVQQSDSTFDSPSGKKMTYTIQEMDTGEGFETDANADESFESNEVRDDSVSDAICEGNGISGMP